MKMTALAIKYKDEKTKHEFYLPITVFKRPDNIKEYAELQEILDRLIDEVRDNEAHPLSLVMQIIGENLEQYDDEHHPAMSENLTPIERVRYLMEQNNLFQKDLAPIFGGQGNVSKFLSGERSLTKRQIMGLKKRFGISADFFI